MTLRGLQHRKRLASSYPRVVRSQPHGAFGILRGTTMKLKRNWHRSRTAFSGRERELYSQMRLRSGVSL